MLRWQLRPNLIVKGELWGSKQLLQNLLALVNSPLKPSQRSFIPSSCLYTRLSISESSCSSNSLPTNSSARTLLSTQVSLARTPDLRPLSEHLARGKRFCDADSKATDDRSRDD